MRKRRHPASSLPSSSLSPSGGGAAAIRAHVMPVSSSCSSSHSSSHSSSYCGSGGMKRQRRNVAVTRTHSPKSSKWTWTRKTLCPSSSKLIAARDTTTATSKETKTTTSTATSTATKTTMTTTTTTTTTMTTNAARSGRGVRWKNVSDSCHRMSPPSLSGGDCQCDHDHHHDHDHSRSQSHSHCHCHCHCHCHFHYLLAPTVEGISQAVRAMSSSSSYSSSPLRTNETSSAPPQHHFVVAKKDPRDGNDDDNNNNNNTKCHHTNNKVRIRTRSTNRSVPVVIVPTETVYFRLKWMQLKLHTANHHPHDHDPDHPDYPLDPVQSVQSVQSVDPIVGRMASHQQEAQVHAQAEAQAGTHGQKLHDDQDQDQDPSNLSKALSNDRSSSAPLLEPPIAIAITTETETAKTSTPTTTFTQHSIPTVIMFPSVAFAWKHLPSLSRALGHHFALDEQWHRQHKHEQIHPPRPPSPPSPPPSPTQATKKTESTKNPAAAAPTLQQQGQRQQPKHHHIIGPLLRPPKTYILSPSSSSLSSLSPSKFLTVSSTPTSSPSVVKMISTNSSTITAPLPPMLNHLCSSPRSNSADSTSIATLSAPAATTTFASASPSAGMTTASANRLVWSDSRHVWQRLTQAFWPGPVQIFFKLQHQYDNTNLNDPHDDSSTNFLDTVSSGKARRPLSSAFLQQRNGDSYVGFSCPSHPLTRRVLQEALRSTDSPCPDPVDKEVPNTDSAFPINKKGITKPNPILHNSEGHKMGQVVGHVENNTTKDKLTNIEQKSMGDASVAGKFLLGTPCWSTVTNGQPAYLTSTAQVVETLSCSADPTPASSFLGDSTRSSDCYILHGEDKRELFHVAPCQYAPKSDVDCVPNQSSSDPPPLPGLWIDPDTRRIEIVGMHTPQTTDESAVATTTKTTTTNCRAAHSTAVCDGATASATTTSLMLQPSDIWKVLLSGLSSSSYKAAASTSAPSPASARSTSPSGTKTTNHQKDPTQRQRHRIMIAVLRKWKVVAAEETEGAKIQTTQIGI